MALLPQNGRGFANHPRRALSAPADSGAFAVDKDLDPGPSDAPDGRGQRSGPPPLLSFGKKATEVVAPRIGPERHHPLARAEVAGQRARHHDHRAG